VTTATHAVPRKNLVCLLAGLALCASACSKDAKPASPEASASPVNSASSATSSQSAARRTSAAPGKIKFQPYDVVDTQQGLVVSRLAVPQGWKSSSRVVWNYHDFYSPVQVSARTESPDGATWIEFFPTEFFVWLDPAHDHPTNGPGLGGIHYPNITLPVAMARYVIGPNRAHTKNLRIVGSRPVNNLPQVFSRVLGKAQLPPGGEGICMRVHYELNGSPVDEEFYGYMNPIQRLASPNGRIGEFRRFMFLVHSVGAKSGKLESARPLLGFVATSIDPNPGWSQRFDYVKKLQRDYYDSAMANKYRIIQKAGERSRAGAAQSDQFLRQIDANLAAQRRTQQASSFTSSSNDDFYKRADDFDQNLRGTEHMQDQYGQVTDQYNNYNYHWADGTGQFVHTNDPDYNPNRDLPGNFEKMTPAPQ
jgi:hypothetical protein